VRETIINLACLLATGMLLALSTILAKVSTRLDVSPVALLAWGCLGAAGVLLGVVTIRGRLPRYSHRILEYALVAATVSFVAPNLLFYSAIPHVGVSFVALAISFPPLFTYLGALALQVERFSMTRAIGVALALLGAGYIAFLKLKSPSQASGWIFAVLAGPVLLAIGNLYRTLRWPEGERPDALAAIMLATSAAMLLLLGVLPGVSLAVPLTRDALLLISAQIATFSLQFAIFFVLQQRGGPVYISLLGAVAAIVGVPVAILVLEEASPAGLTIGGLLIASGVTLVTLGARGAHTSLSKSRKG